MFKRKPREFAVREENQFAIDLEQRQEKLDAPFVIDKKMVHRGEPIVEMRNVTKTYGLGAKQQVAVNDVTMTFYKNENVALLGANGAGKTTTVEMIAGIVAPTSGSITYRFPFKKTFQEGIGIQFQDSSYPPGIVVSDVIGFMVNVYEVDINPAELEQIVSAFGLKRLYRKKVRSLSGGEQQRLNILLALIHKPKVVFLDELSTGLDISVRTEIVDFVKKYCAKFGIQIVLVSHNMDEVSEICDRIVIMQKGLVKVDMWAKDVVARYGSIINLAAKYI